MPELMDGAILCGLIAAFVAWRIRRPDGARRLPFLGVIGIGVVAAYVGPPVFGAIQGVLVHIPGMSRLTETAVLLGLWFALLALTVFEHKDMPRRVPYWMGGVVGLVAAFGVPPVLDAVSGKYQNASLRANINACTSGMLGQSAPREITNTCDHPIVVGLCMPSEKNPEPCRQSKEIAPGEMATFDPGEARLSFLPGNPNGLTVVACRLPNRPSRSLAPLGRGYDGVCLP